MWILWIFLRKNTSSVEFVIVTNFFGGQLSKITIYADYAKNLRKYLQKGMFFGII